MKKETPTLEEVKEYFKNAKEVKCVYSEIVCDISVHIVKDIYLDFEEYWIDINSFPGKCLNLWDKDLGFAEIISFKEIKPKFEHLEEIEVSDGIYYNEKGLFIGYSKDGNIVVENEEGYFCKWRHARKIDLKKIEAIKSIKILMLENNIKIEELKQK
jgi:hypothetical protein